jgi:hypothetical protein
MAFASRAQRRGAVLTAVLAGALAAGMVAVVVVAEAPLGALLTLLIPLYLVGVVVFLLRRPLQEVRIEDGRLEVRMLGRRPRSIALRDIRAAEVAPVPARGTLASAFDPKAWTWSDSLYAYRHTHGVRLTLAAGASVSIGAKDPALVLTRLEQARAAEPKP